jgi:hypothetical protein
MGRVVRKKIIKEVVDSCNQHIKNHGFKGRTLKKIRKQIERDCQRNYKN